MKRSTWTGITGAYRYGTPATADLPEPAMEQLRLMHGLRLQLAWIDARADELRRAGAQKETLAAARRAVVPSCADCTAAGLYWGNYNQAVEEHEGSRQAVIRARTAGHLADLKPPRWDGTGVLHVQLQRGRDKPARSPAMLRDLASPWRNVCRLEPRSWGRRTDREATLHLRIGATAMISVPIVMHRPLPDDADITDVRIVRKKTAGTFRVHAVFSLRLPRPAAPTSGGAAAVRLRWTRTEAGILTAVIAGDLGEPPPATPVRQVAAARYVLILPRDWEAVWERGTRIRGHRDTHLERMRGEVVAMLRANPELAPVRPGDVARWKASSRFVALAGRAQPPLRDLLEAWRQRDRHLWEFEAHERAQIAGRRRDAYRQVAAWMTRQVSGVALDSVRLERMRRNRESEVAAKQRNVHRVMEWAAPGELRQAVEQAAARRGVQILRVGTGDS